MAKNAAFYAPWVGSRYREGFDGVRVLIVGDSHYACGEPGETSKENWTTECVRYWVVNQKEPTPPFWRKLTETVRAALAPEMTEPDIWERLAFYNFIPRLMGSSSERPTRQDYADANDAFPQMYERLPAPPTVILVATLRCWDNMPPHEEDALYVSMKMNPCRQNAYAFRESWAAGIPHPSSIAWAKGHAKWRMAIHDPVQTWGGVLKELASIAGAHQPSLRK